MGLLRVSEQVILTFEGPQVPETVLLGMKRHAVMAYDEPLQCFKCYGFGHKSAKGPKDASLCRKCGEPGHMSRECSASALRCANCGGPHEASWGSCPKRLDLLKGLRARAVKCEVNRGIDKAIPVCPQPAG